MKFVIDSPKYGKHTVLIDDEDFEKVKDFKWSIFTARKLYVFRNAKENGTTKVELLHRRLLNFPNGEVDHINGDGLDNRKFNLRACTNSENHMNRGKQKNNTSGFKGVMQYGRFGKWKAQIVVKRKNIHVGCYDTPEQAAVAYNTAALKYHGEFARLNEVTLCS